MPNSLDTTDLRPPEVQEILSDPPGWLLNSGPFMLFLFTLLILGSAWLIEYPDTVKGVAHIYSLENDNYKARIEVPPQNISDVQVGQTVYIDLTPYPANDFGDLKAIVSEIEYNSETSTYLVHGNLPEGLSTSIGKQLSYMEGMDGSALIQGSKQSILQRLFNHESLIP